MSTETLAIPAGFTLSSFSVESSIGVYYVSRCAPGNWALYRHAGGQCAILPRAGGLFASPEEAIAEAVAEDARCATAAQQTALGGWDGDGAPVESAA